MSHCNKDLSSSDVTALTSRVHAMTIALLPVDEASLLDLDGDRDVMDSFPQKRPVSSSFKFSGIGKREYDDDDVIEQQPPVPLRRAMQFRYSGIGKRDDDDVRAGGKRVANSFRYSGIGKRADDVTLGEFGRILKEMEKRRATSAFRYAGIGRK